MRSGIMPKDRRLQTARWVALYAIWRLKGRGFASAGRGIPDLGKISRIRAGLSTSGIDILPRLERLSMMTVARGCINVVDRMYKHHEGL